MPIKPLKDLTIVAVGDSLVEGYGATEKQDFISLVSLKLGVPILNYGISGNTSNDVLARLESVTEEKPDITILLVGGNDALRKVSKEQTFSNITTIINRLQTKGSMVALIGIQGGLIGNDYQKEFDRIAKETRSLYIPDILDGLIGNPKYMSDAIHPNNAGYAIIAEKVYQELSIYLLKN
ncbi:MAG: GDSL-type esterase/lipase family protein [Candidatus Moranbacteria bacterium]|nr:GDSL-type esterase/lipase family protein [Candidatus Moranbacteria bacterium]